MPLITVPGAQKVRKVGNSLVVTIPADIAAQHDVKAEDLVELSFRPMGIVSRLRPELQQIVDEMLEKDLPALHYLAGHEREDVKRS